jgi:hypothetical protein
MGFFFLSLAFHMVYFLDRLHGIDKEMSKYIWSKGEVCYDIIDDDLVSNDNDYITFIIRSHYPFSRFFYEVAFKDYERLYLTYMLNLLIINPEPKGYSEYFRDDWYWADEFLSIEKFRHSTILEYVYAAFPTIIIVYILVPSLFLLYSLDEDLDPKLTLKIIGHQ